MIGRANVILTDGRSSIRNVVIREIIKVGIWIAVDICRCIKSRELMLEFISGRRAEEEKIGIWLDNREDIGQERADGNLPTSGLVPHKCPHR